MEPCLHCQAPYLETRHQTHGAIYEYKCGTIVSAIQGQKDSFVHRSWSCEEIARLKRDLSYYENMQNEDLQAQRVSELSRLLDH